MNIQRVSFQVGRDFVAKHHYAKKSPSTVKFCHGVFEGDELVGVLLWGFGTRPLATIKKIFPSLGTADYLELCRLCILDKMPRNTESHVLRLSREKIMRDHPNVKVLFSWADGMRGKPGYVYQASGWLYGGFIVSEFYRDSAGEVVHPRLLITRFGHRDKAFAKELGLVKYKGPQFRYIQFLCGHRERKRLLRESPIKWGQPYPKAKDLFLHSEDNQHAGEGSGESRAAVTSCQGPVQFRDPALQQNNGQLLIETWFTGGGQEKG